MISSASMTAGARARDKKNRPGLSWLRMLTWPKESNTRSFANIRLAVTNSSKISDNFIGRFHQSALPRHDTFFDFVEDQRKNETDDRNHKETNIHLLDRESFPG